MAAMSTPTSDAPPASPSAAHASLVPRVLYVAVAEFDITLGNTLSTVVPSDVWPHGETASHEDVAHLCLPDGGHLFAEDWTYLLMAPAAPGAGGFAGTSAGAGAEADAGPAAPARASGRLYGVAHFLNKRDASKKRGADQRSLLVMMSAPLFDTVEPFMRLALPKAMEAAHADDDGASVTAVLRELHATLTEVAASAATPSPPATVSLWGSDVPVTVTIDVAQFVAAAGTPGSPSRRRGSASSSVLPDYEEFGGASLTQLVKAFGENTMVLWYSLLMGHRLLVCGQGVPARTVGMYCLAAPLLVAPLTGFAELLTPYVALTDLDPVMRKTYICGTTNQLFSTKAEWYDCLADAATNTVTHHTRLRVAGDDRDFVRGVIKGIDREGKDEAWVRSQFRSYTDDVMRRLSTGAGKDGRKASKQQEKLLSGLIDSPLYRQQAKMTRRRKGRVAGTLHMSDGTLNALAHGSAASGVAAAAAAVAAAAASGHGGVASAASASGAFTDSDDDDDDGSATTDEDASVAGSGLRLVRGDSVMGSPGEGTPAPHFRAPTRDDSDIMRRSSGRTLSGLSEASIGALSTGSGGGARSLLERAGSSRSVGGASTQSLDDSALGMVSPSRGELVRGSSSDDFVDAVGLPQLRRSVSGGGKKRRQSVAVSPARDARHGKLSASGGGAASALVAGLHTPPVPPARSESALSHRSADSTAAPADHSSDSIASLRSQLQYAQEQAQHWIAEAARIAEVLAARGEDASSAAAAASAAGTADGLAPASATSSGGGVDTVSPEGVILVDFPSRRSSDADLAARGRSTSTSSVGAMRERLRTFGSAARSKITEIQKSAGSVTLKRDTPSR